MVSGRLISCFVGAVAMSSFTSMVAHGQSTIVPEVAAELETIAPAYERQAPKPRLLGSIHEEDQPVPAFDNRDFMRPSTITADVPLTELQPDWRCEGDGCDAFLPVLDYRQRYTDVKGQKRLNSVLGGLSGAIIGEEIGGAPGALVLGAVGAAAGYHVTNKKRWEKEAKEYDAAYQRGDTIVYNPANRLPIQAHWMMAGPERPSQD